MKTFINNKGIEVKVFAETVETSAFDQIVSIANSKAYSDTKIRIMPDCHSGVSCVVGTTIALKDKVIPETVGVDIGCGMLTTQLSNKYIDFVKFDKVINEYIPNGKSIHSKEMVKFDISNLICRNEVDIHRAGMSLGTLGSGNHFIEINKDDENNIYLVIHTGSRKLGLEVCKYYQSIANSEINDTKSNIDKTIKKLKAEGRHKEINKAIKLHKESISKADQISGYLSGEHLSNYLNDMAIVQQFAEINRQTIFQIIRDKMGFEIETQFQTIHNYIDIENNILRKGAVSANNNEMILIPINMRDGSLLCKGKGNPDWNYSAPHGAGRLMSRNQAKNLLSLNSFISTMQGIYTSSVSNATLDEAPAAYKPMNEIIRQVEPTVEIISIIKPLYNFKSQS